MNLIEVRARAYVYAGDWVADCPQDGCYSTEHLFARANPRNRSGPRTVPVGSFACSNCQHQAPIEWPPNLADITAVLMLRPVPQTRNWYPSGHETAVRHRVEHGQSVDDLLAENAAHGVPTGYRDVI